MRALQIKLLRDLWHIRGQAVAIMLVVATGVATFIMFSSTLDSLELTQAHYYETHRFGNVFSSLKRAPESIGERIAVLSGVEELETRVATTVNIDVDNFPEPIMGRLISIPEDSEHGLNKLFIRQGRLVDDTRDDEVVVIETFAKAHNLGLGDRITAVINGRYKSLTIVGTALSPEYIYQSRPGTAFTDHKRFGVFWMAEEALSKATDMDGAFNDLVLTLSLHGNELDVIDQLDDLLRPYGGLGAYGRKDQLSNRFLSEELRQLENNARLFPAVFLGVTIFLLNVVVGRMVSMQREQIATLKALGYDNWNIAYHYFSLVLIIVSAGIAIGILGGIWLGKAMGAMYMNYFSFPFLEYHLKPLVVVNTVWMNVFGALLAAAFSLRAATRLRPAEAMRPEAPTIYRVSSIERLARGLLSQPNRMIIRHVTRRPVKSLLTVLGIAFACAVMMTGRFPKDTVSYMMDVQYSLMKREDVVVNFIQPTSRKAMYELRSLEGVHHVEVFRRAPIRVRFRHRSHRTGILGVSPHGDLQRLLNTELAPIPIPPEGVVMTQYLGDKLGIEVGDRISIEVLEGGRPTIEVEVAALVKEYLDVSVYMEIHALNRLMNEGSAISGAYLQVDTKSLPGLFRYFKETPRIATTLEREQEIRNFKKTMSETMVLITGVATALSVVIAFGVVYNSAIIALAERGRELASLRILGFSRLEISYILLGELALLTIVAIPLGFLFGYLFCSAIVTGLQSELYRLPLVLEPRTYAFAATVVLTSVLLSGLVVRRKLDRLDLLTVLKTKE